MCFEFPWTVLLEKPPGHNLAVAEQIQAIANEKNRKAIVAFNRRKSAKGASIGAWSISKKGMERLRRALLVFDLRGGSLRYPDRSRVSNSSRQAMSLRRPR